MKNRHPPINGTQQANCGDPRLPSPDPVHALRESEERFRKIFETSPVGMALVAADLRFLSVNPAWISMTGYSEQELLSLTVKEITHPDHLAGDQEKIRDLIAGRIPVYSTEKRYIRKSGDILWGLLRVTVIRNEEGAFRYLAAQIEDITERKHAQAALEESNRRLSTLIASLQGMVYRCRNDPDWTMEYVSDGCVDLTGYTPHEFVIARSISLAAITHPEDRKYVWDHVQAAVAECRPFQLRYRILSRDHSIRWVAELGRGVFSSGGELVALEGYIADITEWQNAEEAFHRTHDLLNETQTISRLGGWEFDGATGRITWTDEVYRIHGVTRDFDPSSVDSDLRFFSPGSRERIGEAFRRCCDDAVPYDLEGDLVRADGRKIRVRTMGKPVMAGGMVIRVHGYIMDITEHWQAREALLESTARFRRQYESNPLAIFTWQQKGDDFILADCNAAADLLTKGRSREYLGTWASDLYAARPDILSAIRTCVTSHSVISRELVSEHFLPGRTVYTTTAFVPPDLIMVHMEDITERRKAEQALVEKSALLEAQLHSSLDGTLIVGPDGKKLLQNRRTTELWKIPDAVADDPDDARQVRHVMQMTKYPEQFVEKIRYLYDHPDETSHDSVELTDGTVLDRYSSPVRGADGKYYGRIWKFRDITEQEQAKRVREGLIAELARKNAELDRFTYTASHDLRSPLIAIRSFLALLEDDLKSGDTSRAVSDISQIAVSAEKLESLINSLLALSRSGRTVSTPLPVPLHDCVQSAAGLMDALVKERGVELVVAENLPVIMGDRERLQQVMTNLIDNAIKFMGDQKHPRIEVGMQKEDGSVVFFVRDNGSGIRSGDMTRLFGLYERLDPDIPGSGIGLATVKRIIDAHAGKIWAESEGPGKGTTFWFTLPVAGPLPTDTHNNG